MQVDRSFAKMAAGMKQYPPDKIRNIGVIGAGAVGKTSLCEALLFTAGAISRQGKVLDGNTVSDYAPEEIKRKISIHSSLLPFDWKETKINLIDTPGYIDFIGETLAAMRIVDGLIIVVDAVTGHGAALETLWKVANKYDLPRIIVINKLDKPQADFGKVLDGLRSKFGHEVVPVEIPNGDKVHDLLKHEIPTGLEDETAIHKEMLIEGMAEVDDDILSEYMEGKEITEAELKETLKKAINADKIIPVFCASSFKDLGIAELLDEIVEWMPPANEHPPKEIKPETSEPFCGLVYKTVNEPHIGNLTFVRAYAGTLRPSATVINTTQGKEERIGQIITLRGKTKEDLPLLSAGDIGILPKLKATSTGETLCEKAKQLTLAGIEFPEPTMSFSVHPKSKADQEKMSLGLSSFAHEDPTFKMHYNPETKETVISGMGDIHLEVILQRLRGRFGIEIEIGEPRIPYKETITGKVKAQGKYKKQTGGHGQYGDTWIEIEPLARGKGFEFVDKIVGGAIPRNYIPAVEKGIKEAMSGGVVAGYPVVDVKATLYDGSFHDVDSSDLAFKIAASMGFKKAVQDARPIILEPIVEISVTAPPEFIGDITGDLNKRRGKISTIETDRVAALVPQGEIAKYSTDLRSFTHGQGTFSTKFSHYEPVPPQTQQKLVAIYQKLKEAGSVERQM